MFQDKHTVLISTLWYSEIKDFVYITRSMDATSSSLITLMHMIDTSLQNVLVLRLDVLC